MGQARVSRPGGDGPVGLTIASAAGLAALDRTGNAVEFRFNV